MIGREKNSLIMLVLLGLSIFIYHVGLGIMNARGIEPSPGLEYLYTALFLCGVVWWLRAETEGSPVTRMYCAGVLVGSAWPIIIPYHLLKTRGVRGLLPLFALIATFVFAKLLAAVIYVAISGFASI
jgi:hypothetical protein